MKPAYTGPSAGFRAPSAAAAGPTGPGRAERMLVMLALILFSGAIGTLVITGGDTSATEDGYPILRYLYPPAYLVAIWLSLRSPRALLSQAAANPCVVLLVGLTLASALWSIHPDITLRRSIALGMSTLLGFSLAARFSTRELLRMLATAGLIMGTLSLLFVALSPRLGISQDVYAGAWRGVFQHKNALGQVMNWVLLANLALLLDGDGRRVIRIVSILLCGLLVIASRSATSMLILALLPVIALVAMALRGRSVPWLIALALLLSALIVVVATVAIDPRSAAALIGRDATATGRTELWQLAWGAVAERPLLGYGYGAFWYGLEGPGSIIRSLVGWDVPNAHNGWLDLLVGVGAGGPILMALALLRTAATVAIGRAGRRASAWHVMFLVAFVALNAVESQMAEPNSISWLLYCMTSALTSRRPIAKEPSAAQFPR
jgi:O-antigen ligase